MSSPYEQEIDDLLAQYRSRRDEVTETRRRINEATGTATAKRQAVKVTVTAQGEVTAIEFPTGAYRSLAPKELADLLITTIREARADAQAQVNDLMADKLPEGVKMADILAGTADPKKFLPETPYLPKSILDFVDRSGDGNVSR
jgi:DNA-binding protein YbaB